MLWLLLLAPLLGSLACGALHFCALRARAHARSDAGWLRAAGSVGCAAVALSLLLSIRAWFALAAGAPLALESVSFSWIDAGTFSIAVSLVVDRLSSAMILVVTGVGFLIHVYSLGYMKDDPGFARFFAYLNLFLFAMLVLVLSSNLLGLFVGWEGVGLCSYLLIGFWYQKGWPAEAAQKAFVVNRIGDACFLVGSFVLLGLFGTLDLSEIAGADFRLLREQSALIALAALLLFGGACGKSAQFPLLVWLPDAMAGPTPVSALIHAATMVTAGVYLVLRLNPLFAAAPVVLYVIGCTGAFTALIGATSALLQRDIKKVLAYSTISQLGYMFLGLSAGAWGAALFHLVTHAFFKGLLFLGAGSVIHGLAGEQDLHRMGGLSRAMPRTSLTFLAGAAALSGLPLTSGFFSKDETLAQTFGRGWLYWPLWLAGVAVAALTAFYTWRMVALAFSGRGRHDPALHPHESSAVMTVPLAVLAVLSLAGGLLNLPHVLPGAGVLAHWLAPVTRAGDELLRSAQGGEALHLPATAEWCLLALGAALALLFARLGFRAYRDGPAADERLREARPALARFLEQAWKLDRIYHERIVIPLKLASFLLATLVDQLAIDGLVNGAGALASAAGARLRAIADGQIKSYALWMGAGAAGVALLWMLS